MLWIYLVIYFLLSNQIKNFGIALLAVPPMQLIAYLTLPTHAWEKILSDADNILTSSALVLLMTLGLAFFYGGFTQAKNVLNTMIMSFVMIGIATIVWLVFGFSLPFSGGGSWMHLLVSIYLFFL